jgi:hypothetical protein
MERATSEFHVMDPIFQSRALNRTSFLARLGASRRNSGTIGRLFSAPLDYRGVAAPSFAVETWNGIPARSRMLARHARRAQYADGEVSGPHQRLNLPAGSRTKPREPDARLSARRLGWKFGGHVLFAAAIHAIAEPTNLAPHSAAQFTGLPVVVAVASAAPNPIPPLPAPRSSPRRTASQQYREASCRTWPAASAAGERGFVSYQLASPARPAVQREAVAALARERSTELLHLADSLEGI